MKSNIKLPEWVLQEENYQPNGDRDHFITRSLLRIMQILRALRYQSRRKNLTNFSAAGAFSFILVLVILCTSAHTLNFLFCVLALELVLMCLLDGRTIQQLLQNSIMMSIFSAMFVLPAYFLGNRAILILLPLKTFLTVTALSLLITFFRWHQITETLKYFHIPAVVIFVLDTTLRYIVLLGEISKDMLIALKLRSVGINREKKAAISGILGNVFLKSREMSEEMYQAMCCRCFTGEYTRTSNKMLRVGDFAFILLTIVYIWLFILMEGKI